MYNELYIYNKVKLDKVKLESLPSFATDDEQKILSIRVRIVKCLSTALYRDRTRSCCMHVFLVSCYLPFTDGFIVDS